jgi:Gpi18-like mannosyltransferase
MGYWAAVASEVSRERLRTFAILIKLPGLLAELGTAALLYRIGRAHRGPLGGALAVATYGWALCAILVSGFHGNTDALYAFLCLLAAYYASEPRRFFMCGLALAGALNVKLLPLLLIPPLAAQCRSTRDLRRFLGGLSVAAIPYLPFVFTVGPSLYRNMLAYNSNQDNWGLVALLNASYATQAFGDAARHLAAVYFPLARYMILVAIAVASLQGWRVREPAYRLCALSFIVFLVLTPGFGVQYTIMVAPLLCAVSLGRGAVYASLAGVFIGSVYLYFKLPGTPWQSNFWSLFPRACALLGMLAWGYLAETGIRLCWDLARRNPGNDEGLVRPQPG